MPATVSTRRSIAWYSMPRVVAGASALLLLPVYTRVLGPAELGTAMVVLAVAGLSGMIVAPGMEAVYLRSAARSSEQSEDQVCGTVLRVHLTMLALGTAVLLLGAGPISRLLMPGVPIWPFYHLVVAMVVLGSVRAPLIAGWRMRRRSDLVARLELARTAVAVTVVLVTLLVFDLGAISLILGEVVAGVVLLPICVRPMIATARLGWTGPAVATVLPLVLVGVPLTVSGFALSTLDRLFVNGFAGSTAVGLYSVGFQLGVAIMSVGIVLNKEWQPLIFTMVLRGGDPDEKLQRLWLNSVKLFVLAGGCVACYSREIVHVWLGEGYESSAAVVAWVAVTSSFRIARTLLRNLGLAKNRSADLAVETIVSTVVFVVANVVLIPRFGIVGAAWAGVAAYAAGALYLHLRSWNSFRVDWQLAVGCGAAFGAAILGSRADGAIPTKLLGLAFIAGAGILGARYWRFLGTFDSLRTPA